MRLLPRSEARKEKNAQTEEATRQRRLMLDEVTKISKRLNLERELAEKERQKLSEGLEEHRLEISGRKAALVTEVGALEARKREIESSVELLDVQKLRAEVSEREKLVRQKFEELTKWEERLSRTDSSVKARAEQNKAEDERIFTRFKELESFLCDVTEREAAVTASETSLVERMKTIDLAIQKRHQELVLRDHDLDLRELELKSLKEVYERRINEPPPVPQPIKVRPMVVAVEN